MKKLLFLLPLFLLIALPVFASKDHPNLKEKELETDVSPAPTTTCDPNNEWKNHGEYVSCVAHQKQNGDEVSEAARSDVGKKTEEPEDENEDGDDDDSEGITPTTSVTPSVSPTEVPSVSPSITPTISPEASPSINPTATVSPEPTILVPLQREEVGGMITTLENILNFLKKLIGLE